MSSTLRDKIALRALGALIERSPTFAFAAGSVGVFATAAYDFADVMLAERERRLVAERRARKEEIEKARAAVHPATTRRGDMKVTEPGGGESET